MEKVSIHEIELDRCNSCSGIWFDEYELSDFKRIEDSESVDIGDSSVGKEQNKNDLRALLKTSRIGIDIKR